MQVKHCDFSITVRHVMHAVFFKLPSFRHVLKLKWQELSDSEAVCLRTSE